MPGIQVDITGDASQFKKELNSAVASTNKANSGFAKMQKGALVAGAAITGGLVVALKGSVGAAQEAQVSQAKMQSQLDALGISYDKHADQIEKVIQSTSKLAALDDEDLQDAFTQLVRTTGDVNEALRDTELAANIARGAGVSLATATKAISNAELGRVSSLKKLGVAVPAVGEAQAKLKAQIDAYKETHKSLSPLMKQHFDDLMKQAKADDAAATTKDALSEAERKFGDAAEKYGNTSAAASERFHVALENLQETIGAALLPALTTFSNALAKITSYFAEHETLAKAVVIALGALGATLLTIGAATKVYAAGQTIARAATVAWTAAQWLLNAALTANPIGVVIVALAALAAAIKIAWDHSETFRRIVTGAFNAVKTAAESVIGWVKNNWPIIVTLLSGPFAPIVALATDAFGVRSAMIGAFNAIKGVVVGVLDTIIAKFTWLGTNTKRIWNTISSGMTAAISAITGPLQYLADLLHNIIGAMEEIVDRVGDVLGAVGKIGGAVGKIGGLIPGRASGGPVSAGQAYVVGERGPELFIPGSDGQIAANWSAPNAARGGGGVNVTIAGGTFMGSKDEIAEALVNAVHDSLLRKQRRTGGLGFA